VVRVAALALLVVSSLARDAASTPLARQRVVLADPDPELRHAMEQALEPWHLEVVIEASAPADATIAQQRADAATARFVVWRDGEQLVVYDRELGSTERRISRSRTLDPPAAAAAALTIKTMMRLPPPPAVPLVAERTAQPAPAVDEPGVEVRVQAGVATRFAHGDGTAVSARFGGAAELRPWAVSEWRLGVAGDGGTSTSVSRASFKGTWNDWAVLGVASWTYARGAWAVEPHAGVGVRHSTLDGTEMNTPRSESATVAMLRGGVWVRWRLARWTLGVALEADTSFGTPTYSKTGTPAEIFQVPGAAAELGAVIAVDL